MKGIDLVARRIRFRVQRRQPALDPQRYRLASDELLEYPAFHGMRSLCHLFIYLAANTPCLSIVGNFDAPPGALTTNLIEAVATAISDRIGGDDFRLIEWYPHAFGGSRFSEVRLEPAPLSTEPHGETFITKGNGHQGNGNHLTILEHTHHATTTRFANPTWRPVSTRQLAKLVGRDALHDMFAMSGITGDYTPERLFGSTGRRLAEEIRAHNDAQATEFHDQIREWQAARTLDP